MKLSEILNFLVLVFFAVNRSSYCCPSTDVSPCHCKNQILTCSGVHDQKKLIKVLREVSDTGLDEIILDNIIFQNLDISVYQNLGVPLVRFKNVTLNNLAMGTEGKSPFYNNRTITWEITSCRIMHNWDWSLLGGFSNLDYLAIYNSSFHYLPNNTFVSNSISSLTIQRSGVKWIENFAFQRLNVLFSLDLSRNEIMNISKEILANKHLQVLNMGYNWISHLPPEVFSYNPAMKEIVLVGNNIEVFNYCPLFSFHRIAFIHLSGNPLHCSQCLVEWKFCFSSKIADYKSLRCSSPDNVKGRKLHELSEEDLECPASENRCDLMCNQIN